MLYEIVKFLHILAAILWLGGGATMMVLGFIHRAAADQEAFLAVVRQISVLATRWFVPSSLVVLVSGLAMVWLGGFGWPAWIVLGLLGIAFTAAFGSVVLSGLARQSVTAPDRAGALAHGYRLIQMAKFDYCVLFAIVWVMTTKPQWGDGLLLAPALAVILLGGALFLRPAPRALTA